MTAALLILLCAFALALVVLCAAAWSNARPSCPQQTPFLGGGTQDAHAWQRFHFRAYPMLLLFIAFEMEMMFMYPWAVVFVQQGLKALLDMGVFLAILCVGIVYAWREGVFRWQ